MHTNSHLHSYCKLAGCIFFLTAHPLPGQIGIGLSPMRLEMKLQPGMQHSGALVLTSDSKDKVRVRAEPLDFLIDGNQTPQFESRLSSESEFSCRDWLSINPGETEIEPGGQVSVRYTVRIPVDAKSPRGYHCAIGFATLPTDAQIGAGGIRTAVQVVSALYVTTGTPDIVGQFEKLSLVRDASDKGGWEGEVVLRNGGATHFRPVGELSLLNGSGKVVESAPLTPLPALPQRQQRYFVHFRHDLSPGSYTLRARLDFGRNVIEEGTSLVRIDE